MKKNNLLKGVFAVLLLSSPLVGAETKYPAADFKPTVQYQDAEYIAKSKSSGATGQSQATPADSQYPATAFQPKVLYQDTEYKHGAPKVAASKPRAAAPSSMATEKATGAEAVTEKKAESKSNYLIALVVLAVVGFVFFRKRSAPEPAARRAAVYSADTSGLTGVAKYVQRQQGPTATGVAKYLEKQVAAVKEKAASTGVAKYLEKKMVESETGVSKYLRNKG